MCNIQGLGVTRKLVLPRRFTHKKMFSVEPGPSIEEVDAAMTMSSASKLTAHQICQELSILFSSLKVADKYRTIYIHAFLNNLLIS